MTSQEIFTTVKNHLLKQNERSLLGGMCAYRSQMGLKCAVGALIRDEDYRLHFEGFTVFAYEIKDALYKNGVSPVKHLDLLVSLQKIHDAEEPHEWPYKLQQLAAEKGLKYAD